MNVPEHDVVDVVSTEGITELELPDCYPFDVPHAQCHPIARAAYANRTAGITCRSNAEATKTTWIGEALALFDHVLPVPELSARQKFSAWYPDADPDA